MSTIRYGSVCSGIEAATCAWHPLGWQAAWFSEIEPFPKAVLAHRHPTVPDLDDMTNIPARIRAGEVEAPDLLVGGTPCQSFSIAGLRRGLADPRGQLTRTFVEILDAIDSVRTAAGRDPGLALWENVPGVLSDDDNAFGNFLAAIVGEDRALDPPGGRWSNAGCVLGPTRRAAWRILDAQYFGLAQRRRRVFLVASARAGPVDPVEVLLVEPGVQRNPPARSQAGQSPATAARGSAALDSGQAGHGDFTGDGGDGGRGRGVAFDTTQITNHNNRSNPQPGDPCHPLAAGAHPPAVAYAQSAYPDPAYAVAGGVKFGGGRAALDTFVALPGGEPRGESSTFVAQAIGNFVAAAIAGTLVKNNGGGSGETQNAAYVVNTLDEGMANDDLNARRFALQPRAQNWDGGDTSQTLTSRLYGGLGAQQMPDKGNLGAVLQPLAVGVDSYNLCETGDVQQTLKSPQGGVTESMGAVLQAMSPTPHANTWANGGGHVGIVNVEHGLHSSGNLDIREVSEPITSSERKGHSVVLQPEQESMQPQGFDILGTPATQVGKETEVHTPLRARTPGQFENSTVTVVVSMRESGPGYGLEDEVSGTLDANMGMSGHANRVATLAQPPAMAVRRLTPRECERLQGFPDDWTLIPYRKGEAGDSNRYHALGNSMAVPVMAWIGRRIADVRAGTAPRLDRVAADLPADALELFCQGD